MTDPSTDQRESKFEPVALAIPAYNEADGIAGFLGDLDAVLTKLAQRHCFVVVNDCSTDSTAEVLDALGPGLAGELISMTNRTNSGHGPTVLNAYRGALDTGAEWILQVDGDGQFEAEDIGLLFSAARAGSKVVTGQRTTRFDPWYRRVVTATLPVALRVGFGVRRRDVNCPLRLYSRDALSPIIDKVPPDSLTPHVLMTILESRSHHQHSEIEVRHRPRRGHSEVGSTWRDGKNLVMPIKLIRFLKASVIQLIRFGRSL